MSAPGDSGSSRGSAGDIAVLQPRPRVVAQRELPRRRLGCPLGWRRPGAEVAPVQGDQLALARPAMTPPIHLMRKGSRRAVQHAVMQIGGAPPPRAFLAGAPERQSSRLSAALGHWGALRELCGEAVHNFAQQSILTQSYRTSQTGESENTYPSAGIMGCRARSGRVVR